MYYRKAKEVAMNNGEIFHIAAILIRNKHIVRIGTNSSKTHPKFRRLYRNGGEGAHLHAEMDVLRFARPGDCLLVLRFSANGTLTMAKPCEHCQKFIRQLDLGKVKYTDWDGQIQEFKLVS